MSQQMNQCNLIIDQVTQIYTVYKRTDGGMR